LAKPNYQFEKRKRDLEKKARKEQKRLRKKEAKEGQPTETTDAPEPSVPENG
jgi:hypothetical protein